MERHKFNFTESRNLSSIIETACVTVKIGFEKYPAYEIHKKFRNIWKVLMQQRFLSQAVSHIGDLLEI